MSEQRKRWRLFWADPYTWALTTVLRWRVRRMLVRARRRYPVAPVQIPASNWYMLGAMNSVGNVGGMFWAANATNAVAAAQAAAAQRGIELSATAIRAQLEAASDQIRYNVAQDQWEARKEGVTVTSPVRSVSGVSRVTLSDVDGSSAYAWLRKKRAEANSITATVDTDGNRQGWDHHDH